MPSRCPNSRLIVANIASRSVRLLTSARTARLPAPSVSLAAFSVFSFKPQMATRAPSLSNSCAAANPIPLLPPVIRRFLPASLPIVVSPRMPWAVRGSHLCEAAVHTQFRARDVAAVVGGEKQHGLRDLIGCTAPAQRNTVRNHLEELLASCCGSQVIHRGRIDEAWAHRVHANAAILQVRCPGP